MKNEESFEDFMKRLLGEGKENPPHVEESAEEKPDQVYINVKSDNGIITLVEPDEESGLMFQRQQQYEAELEELDFDDPRRMFPHNFLQKNYLPVVTVQSSDRKKPEPEKVADEIREIAYYADSKGNFKLDEVQFCRTWKENYNYVYSGGRVLTPEGIISEEDFKSEITKMLGMIHLEKKGVNRTSSDIFNTYLGLYKEAEKVDENKIPFRNGDLILNPDKKGYTFYEGSRSAVAYRFNYDFKNIPNCEEPDFPNFRSWLDGLFEIDDQYTLKQMLGYLMIPSTEAQEAFFIVGKGGSGKSVLTDCVIPKMLGCAMAKFSISNFFKSQFGFSTSVGKLCIVDDDIGETTFSKDDSGKFKSFVTSNTIQVEQKFHDAITVNNVARIVCSGNHMINSDDKTDGFTRRLHPIYAKPRTIENIDTKFPQKVAKEIDMIVLWALEGLLEMYKNGGVPYRSYKTKEHFEHYAESQKWEEQFVDECFCYKEGTVTCASDIKDALQNWMKDNIEVCGDGTVNSKYWHVAKWLRDEGAEKNGFIYKKNIKKDETYSNRGFVNMSLKEPVMGTTVFTNEHGGLSIRIKRKKPEDQDRLETEED